MTEKVNLPSKFVKKTLNYVGLCYRVGELPDGRGVQIKLTKEGFERVNINVYTTHSVVVQPHNASAAKLVRCILAMRAAKLRREGKIE